MSYETYKLGKLQNTAGKRGYAYEELEQMDLPRLREICSVEHIKPPTMETLNQKNELVKLIFRYLGTENKPDIRRYDPVSIGRLEAIIAGQDGGQDSRIELPSHLKLYKGFRSLDEKENTYEIKSAVRLGGYGLLTGAGGTIEAILTVVPAGKKHYYRLGLEREMMSKTIKTGTFRDRMLYLFEEGFMDDVVTVYHGAAMRKTVIPYIKVRVPEVLVVEVPETDEVLVIDYGTSYTTAGTYRHGEGKSGRIGFTPAASCDLCTVTEPVRGNGPCEWCELCPSVVAVKRIEGNQIEFLYGHEAIREEQRRGYISKSSVFYDAKRWVNHYRERIKVSDFDGNTCEIEGSYIVGAFLLYIIKTAEQQNKVRYKNIYITCPVKQKALSLKMYQDVLGNYNVMTEVTDEAVAVLYHALNRRIREMDYKSGEIQKVLILDCGGGTSDMVRCDYSVMNRSITSEVDMEIRYAHGDTNFGGNNLTYRILQYCKIRLAEYYSAGSAMDLEELFSGVLEDLYGFVDQNGAEQAYKALSEQYEWAETVIPTCFQRYRTATEQTYLRVKGNYYFLWNLAERLKKEAFNRAGMVSYPLPSFFQEPGRDRACYESFHLSVRNKKGVLETYTACPELILQKEEINLLLKPDIYHLIKSFIEPYYLEGMLDEIQMIYLSGQTCKIDLFREVLKEFIAGRKAKTGAENSCAKKFMCIDGAVAFQGDKKIGRIRPSVRYASALVPYHLTVPDFQTRETYLIREGTAMEEVYGYQSRPVETEEIVFTLKDRYGKELSQYVHKLHFKEYEKTNYGFLLKEYPVLRQEDIDNIVDAEVKLFVFTDNESWGFFVLEVARTGEGLFYKAPGYIPFENSEWEKNFFDGLH